MLALKTCFTNTFYLVVLKYIFFYSAHMPLPPFPGDESRHLLNHANKAPYKVR